MKDKQNSRRLVLFYAAFPLAVNEPNLYSIPAVAPLVNYGHAHDALAGFLDERYSGQFLKLGEGTFLLDEDRCFPALLEMISYCNDKKLPLLIAPLGDSHLSITPHGQGWPERLTEMKLAFRLTKLLPVLPVHKLS